MRNLGTDSWVRRPQPNPEARLRLFCLPYAGGGASIFRTWPSALPADVAVCAAAVADWYVVGAGDRKLKKSKDGTPALEFGENPDILKTLSHHARRPALMVGFAAETHDVVAHATAKRVRKGCDWIVANDVRPETGIMGGTDNAVTLITAEGAEDWPRMTKTEVAQRLAQRIAEALAE